jgi:hypothetical protein
VIKQRQLHWHFPAVGTYNVGKKHQPREGKDMAKKGQAQEGAQPEEGPGLLDQIRDAIRKSGRTLNQMEKDTGVSRGELSRFLRGQRVLGGEPLERICRSLNLRLIGGPAEGKKKGKVK